MRDISLRGWGLQSEAVYQGTAESNWQTFGIAFLSPENYRYLKFELCFSLRNHHCFSLEFPLSLSQLAPREAQTLNTIETAGY